MSVSELRRVGFGGYVARRYPHSGPLAAADWQRAASAYGGYHPSDLDIDALVEALDTGSIASVEQVVDAAWEVQCAAEADLPWPPQSLSMYKDEHSQTIRLWYGGGRSQAHLVYGYDHALVEVRVCAPGREGGGWHNELIEPTRAALARHWYARLEGWAGHWREQVDWAALEAAGEEVITQTVIQAWAWWPGVTALAWPLWEGDEGERAVRTRDALRYLGVV